MIVALNISVKSVIIDAYSVVKAQSTLQLFFQEIFEKYFLKEIYPFSS